MVMLGALMQILPVVAGSPVPAVIPVAAVSHAGLAIGTPLLAWGLASGEAAILNAAGLALGLGLTVFLIPTAISLARARTLDSVRAMALSVAALAVTVLLGLSLTAWLAGHWAPADPIDLLGRHALAGLAGWVGVLVVGTAWQVVPMLQLTPAYPPRLTRALLIGFALALPAALLPPAPWQIVGEAGLALGLVVFALATLDLQRRRKRKIGDTTLRFWRLGMICLALAAALSPLPLPEAARMTAGMLFVAGFGVSVVNGMLYKIVPFLAWFHLHAQKGLPAAGRPSMKDYLPESRGARPVPRLPGGPGLPAGDPLRARPGRSRRPAAGGFLGLAGLESGQRRPPVPRPRRTRLSRTPPGDAMLAAPRLNAYHPEPIPGDTRPFHPPSAALSPQTTFSARYLPGAPLDTQDRYEMRG
jgi:hypothetical protein